MARPSKFSMAVAEEICEAIAGGAALHLLAEVKTNWPHERTIYRWLESNEEFRQMYARARERQADRLAAEILTIADNPQEGEKVEITDKGEKIIRGDMIEHRRLQVDARKWAAAKLAPKKYGDRVATELTGRDGGPIETQDVSARELVEGRLARLAAGGGSGEGS